jgi:hypothetical protein
VNAIVIFSLEVTVVNTTILSQHILANTCNIKPELVEECKEIKSIKMVRFPTTTKKPWGYPLHPDFSFKEIISVIKGLCIFISNNIQVTMDT